ncbi:MAG: hypothetical protein KAX49_09330 [Halanaerobiales bacterium]|nr:hypothetical protein [Halanaerobiales bacterium]
MKKNEQLKLEYLETLDKVIKDLNQKALKAKEGGSMDEFILGKIKCNVVDIFQKMFNTSYQNVYVALKIPHLKEHIAQYENKHEQLYAAYMSFFEKISAPWKEKALKDKEFGKLEDYHKEQEKLNMAEEVKKIFKEHYQRIFGGE